jgi:hypothetical protein
MRHPSRGYIVAIAFPIDMRVIWAGGFESVWQFSFGRTDYLTLKAIIKLATIPPKAIKARMIVAIT